MNVSLTPYFEKLIQAKVASGRYGNISEVVREGLRLLEIRDQEHAARLRDLRQAIDEGIDSGSAEPLDMAQIKREARTQGEAQKMITKS